MLTQQPQQPQPPAGFHRTRSPPRYMIINVKGQLAGPQFFCIHYSTGIPRPLARESHQLLTGFTLTLTL